MCWEEIWRRGSCGARYEIGCGVISSGDDEMGFITCSGWPTLFISVIVIEEAHNQGGGFIDYYMLLYWPSFSWWSGKLHYFRQRKKVFMTSALPGEYLWTETILYREAMRNNAKCFL
jgi:hypothetical protein